MRLRLSAAGRSLLLLAVALLSWLVPLRSGAEDRLVVRGNYYREDSTRILAPTVSYQKDVLDEHLTLGAEYLMDTITSASIGAGAAILGGDKVFTEIRHEALARASSRLGPWGLGASFRYSTETDYIASNFGFGLAREFLQKTLNFSLNYSYEHDRLYRILNNLGVRSPWRSIAGYDESGAPVAGPDNLLQIHYLDAGWGSVFWKTVVGGANVEISRATGPQDNPYRSVRNGLPETHPLLRHRLAASTFVMWSIPRARLVIEPRYRYYVDDWQVSAHAIDTRLHVRVLRHLRLRLRYRYYTQTAAHFYDENGEYEPTDRYKTADPKLWAFQSHTPGLQVTWELDDLARFRGLHWLSGAWVEATYNHIFRLDAQGRPDQRYGDARMGSLAFSLAF